MMMGLWYLEKLFFRGERLDAAAHYWGARVEREDVAYERVFVALLYDHVSDLNDAVLLRLGEYS